MNKGKMMSEKPKTCDSSQNYRITKKTNNKKRENEADDLNLGFFALPKIFMNTVHSVLCKTP